MNLGGSKRLQSAINSGSRRPTYYVGHVILCIHFCLVINRMQSTFATKINTSRYHNMWSEPLTFNDQAIRSDICFLAARPYTIVLVADWWIEIKVLDQVKSSIRFLCKCQRNTDYILIIAVTDASMIYREGI